MHKFTLASLVSFLPLISLAQATTEKINVRLYEHHSSDMNQGQPFGMGADGSKSGYDFVNHVHYNSFNPSTFGSWTAAELVNIDMVEHKGPYGGSGFSTPFGFTSGTSTIWNGDIAGNDVTLYAAASPSFDYTAATDVAYIKDAFDLAITSKEIPAVAANKIYLAKIRNTDEYVAIKVTNVKNAPPNLNPGVDIASVYFDFDYKYGTYDPTLSVKNVSNATNTFAIAPNPAKGQFQISVVPQQLQMNNATMRIVDVTGKTVHTQLFTSTNINVELPVGNYVILLSDKQRTYSSRLIIAE